MKGLDQLIKFSKKIVKESNKESDMDYETYEYYVYFLADYLNTFFILNDLNHENFMESEELKKCNLVEFIDAALSCTQAADAFALGEFTADLEDELIKLGELPNDPI